MALDARRTRTRGAPRMSARTFSFALDAPRPPQVGLVALQSDETVEPDLRRLLPETLDLLVTRVPSGAEVTAETLAAMEHHLAGAASLFPPGARFRAVGYACTSGTAQIGRERIAALVGDACRTQAATEPVSALIAACGALGVRRLALLSPYIAAVSERLRAVLAEAGIATPLVGSFDVAEEARVARIGPDSIMGAARSLAARGGADAIFLSCTNLRTLDVIAPLEAETTLPVLSSNLVLAWHMAELASSGLARGAPGCLAALGREVIGVDRDRDGTESRALTV